MWIRPSGLASFPPPLSVFNSLTKAKDELKTLNGKVLTWYCCGPTVYDSAHLGHARAYISFDIRRIISDYLGYTVNYVMNITDIGDKIILKARQKHLLEGAISETTTPE
jgi:cysteinyl-tRNA synthetase